MNEIIKLLKEKGPLTGKELLEKSRRDALLLWHFCNKTEEIYTKAVFIIAGDVVYNMAHSELRPEVSTGGDGQGVRP